MKQPNIIFLFSDQQRVDTVSAYGKALGANFNLTPHLDALAEEGTLFLNHMTCQPVCGPARAVLQTGRYASQIPVEINDVRLPDGVPTLATYLTDAGYETAYVGKWHLASQHTGKPEAEDYQDYRTKAIPEPYRGGYKDWWIASDVLEFTSHGYGGEMFDAKMHERPFEHYRADATTDFALEYLEDRKRREATAPYFLFVSYIEPHHQNDRDHFEGPEGSKEKFKDYEVPEDLVLAKEKGSAGDWEKEMPDYLGQCASLDENVGRILEAIPEDERDNTIVIYTSDHGCHFRTRNAEYKRSCHDASIHVPLIISGPGFEDHNDVEHVTSLIDLPPTILRAAGIDVPSTMQGYPLQELVDEGTFPRDAAYVEISESGHSRAIRTDRYTYAVDLDISDEAMNRALQAMFQGEWDDNPLFQSQTAYREAKLYDNEKDPAQWTNRIADPAYAEVKQTLREKLIEMAQDIEGLKLHIKEVAIPHDAN